LEGQSTVSLNKPRADYSFTPASLEACWKKPAGPWMGGLCRVSFGGPAQVLD